MACMGWEVEQKIYAKGRRVLGRVLGFYMVKWLGGRGGESGGIH